MRDLSSVIFALLTLTACAGPELPDAQHIEEMTGHTDISNLECFKGPARNSALCAWQRTDLESNERVSEQHCLARLSGGRRWETRHANYCFYGRS